ncbi:MAG: helix-turn-helix transcriptional regulator [Erysipelotrichaceae bacterium]|nr:helix-turn-helix transcriptional regulator [Erysipelotrichaceae bacterium]
MTENEKNFTWEDYKREYMTPDEIKRLEREAASLCKLIELRDRLHLTQKDVSSLSGIKQPMIARLESGQVNARIRTVQKYLSSMGYTLAVIRKDDPEKIIMRFDED